MIGQSKKETGTTDGAHVANVKAGKTFKTTYMTKEEWMTFEDGGDGQFLSLFELIP